MAEKCARISLKPLKFHFQASTEYQRKQNNFFFIYKLSDILLQSSLIYSERFQIFLVQLYLIYIHILHPYMYTFKYISKCTNCCCNFVLQKLDSEIIQVFFFFSKAAIFLLTSTQITWAYLCGKKKSFNPSGTLLLTEST